MRCRPGTLAAVALVVVAALAGAAVGSAAGFATENEPSLSVAIDSNPVEDGDQYETGGDPVLDVEASADPETDRSLTEVVVRVNGDFYRNYSADGREFSTSVDLSLETGENTVRVIATDDHDRATSTTFTVVKDDRRPAAYLTSPYETTPFLPIRDDTTSGSWTTFNATVEDFSAVPEGTITHRWNDSYEVSVPIRDASDNFTKRIFLGYGSNSLRLTLDDEYGNTKIYDFDVNVTDGAAPAVALDPYPTRIRDSEFVLSGRVTDDVWVDKARIVVTQDDGDERIKKHIVRSADYHIDPGRTNISFNKSIFLFDPGTYTVNITLRDHVGRVTNRTFRVERLPERELAVAPEIRVNRDRTVVLDSETLFVDGLAYDGQIRRLVVETRDPDSGRTIGYHRIYSDTKTRRVAFDRNVTIQPGRTVVIVRAVDAEGGEHARRFVVDGATMEAFVGNEIRDASGRSDASVTVTPLQNGAVGTASSSVIVAGGQAGTGLRIPARGADSGAVVGTENVALERVDVALRADANFTLGVTTRDRTAGDLLAPSGVRPAASTTIQHSLPNDRIQSASLVFRVRSSYLDDQGFDRSNLTVYRLADGSWTPVDTTDLGSDGTNVRYQADSPGFSVFTVGTSVTDGDVGLSDDAANGTDRAGATNASDGRADPASGTTAEPEDDGAASMLVRNVTVNATDVSPGQPVAVNATIANDGDADGTYVAALRVLDPPNITLVDRQTVDVPAGNTSTVRFVHRFNETGSYNVSVNGTRGGPVTVTSGGLLSVLSIVPVRLLGMGAAGLVGLGVVVLLVRFVLRRVGSSDDAG